MKVLRYGVTYGTPDGWAIIFTLQKRQWGVHCFAPDDTETQGVSRHATLREAKQFIKTHKELYKTC